MDNIQVLDCTLRDGGYVNNFNFGQTVMKRVIQKLSRASIDIIECGFLRGGADDFDKSLFPNIESISTIIGTKRKQSMYVAMIQYGLIDVNSLEPFSGNSIDGIRLTFHGEEVDGAFEDAKRLMEKGYKVFIQPVGTATYSDAELIQLIQRVNQLKPYAFYIVDTFGTMYPRDILRMFLLVDHNLSTGIKIGFHSHNNLQLSFSNAQELLKMNTARSLILDSTIYGMGRGAGNLCTELITQYINENIELRYSNLDILEILDSYIRPLKTIYKWGYSSAFYLSSVNNCHPNYAQYLLNLHTLRVQDINAILSVLNSEERIIYNEKYIEAKYMEYMGCHIDDSEVCEKYRELLRNKIVVIMAPGKSILTAKGEIINLLARDDTWAVSINFFTDLFDQIDAIFVSSIKRFDTICAGNIEIQNTGTDSSKEDVDDIATIITSNITSNLGRKVDQIDYSTYLNEEKVLIDNAGLMCINFLRKVNVEEVILIGFDGFSNQPGDNFFTNDLYLDVEEYRADTLNQAFHRKINQLRKQMRITFFTPSAYEVVNE